MASLSLARKQGGVPVLCSRWGGGLLFLPMLLTHTGKGREGMDPPEGGQRASQMWKPTVLWPLQHPSRTPISDAVYLSVLSEA